MRELKLRSNKIKRVTNTPQKRLTISEGKRMKKRP